MGATPVTTDCLRNALMRLDVIGNNSSFQETVARIPIFASSNAAVLIEGESGTGKDVFARAIHSCSQRQGNFVAVNCSAIPPDLFEREMFGHKRSAFTGAVTSEIGLVQAAENGTLFLDEVDSLALHTQPKLLRFLQEKEYRPLGSTATQRADVRIIAASNVNLTRTVRSGRFRQDLYYRLAILLVVLPPLRKRSDDIAPLAAHFLSRYAAERQSPAKRLSPDALNVLHAHDWPGNIRELQHVLERASVLSSDRVTLEPADIQIIGEGVQQEALSFQEAKRRVVADFERRYLERLLACHSGNIAGAARAAKKHRRAFWELLRKHSISAETFRERREHDTPVGLALGGAEVLRGFGAERAGGESAER